MKKIYTSMVSVLLIVSTFAQTGIPIPEMTQCDANAMNLLSTYGIPGMSVALAKDGKLIYSRSFGKSNIGLTNDVEPHNLFRIASISKPITSIAMMKMIESGSVSLSDKVFGAGGLLENHFYFSTATITDTRIYDITVQMLLEHSAGFNRGVNCFPSPTSPYPYWFGGCDPIVAPLHITETLGEANPATEEMLVTFLLERGLDFTPGTGYAYSNMGYLILGEIIEEISGLSYENYVKQTILHPLGIYDMHLGKNLLADKMEREVEYIGEGYTNLSIYGDGNYVPWEYGGFNLEAFDAHGGWIATARDMVRLLVAVDGFTTKPDILTPASITSMTTPSANASYYAKGWSVNTAGHWWHTGAVDGTASEWVRTSDGYTWAIVLNKRITTAQANNFWIAVDNLGWQCRNTATSTPSHDFLEAPTINASGLTASNITDTSMTLSWTNGNGTGRIVVAKEIVNTSRSSHFDVYPLDGTDYTANNQFGLGDDIGDGSYVVYNGSGSSFALENLSSSGEYVIRVYEYEKSTGTGNNTLYMLGNVDELQTTTLGIDDNSLKKSISIHPTITSNEITVKMKDDVGPIEFTMYNVLGEEIKNGNINASPRTIDVSSLQSGLYILSFSNEGRKTHYRFVKK